MKHIWETGCDMISYPLRNRGDTAPRNPGGAGWRSQDQPVQVSERVWHGFKDVLLGPRW